VAAGFVDEADVAQLALAVLGRDDTIGEAIPLTTEVATYRELVARLGRLLGADLGPDPVPLGGAITTVPASIAGTLTALLTMAATSPPDTLTTPEVARRFGLRPIGIDDFLGTALAGWTALTRRSG